jgi:hypothetical protein
MELTRLRWRSLRQEARHDDLFVIGLAALGVIALRAAVVLLHHSTAFRRARTPRTALAVLEATNFDAVGVVMSNTDHRLVGCVREADLLRYHVEEADRMRAEIGEIGLFTDLTSRRDPP